MGQVRLMRGDCLDRMSEIEDNSIDLILCDLPYGTTSCKWDAVIDLEEMWKHYKRVTTKNAAIVLNSAQPFTSALVMSNPKAFKYEWIWKKPQGTNPLHAKRQPLRNHESILVFSFGKIKYAPQMWKSVPYKGFTADSPLGGVYGGKLSAKYTREGSADGLRYPLSIQEFELGNRKKNIHPTQKPVSMARYFIQTYSDKGMTVLDNCMGSGTTGEACVLTNRNFVGIEEDKKFYQLAKNRIKALR